MIYSSGLTGYSMGAMITQGNLMHQSDLLRLCMDGDDTDTTLTLIPCFHSFSASGNMLSMLRYGGTIYLMRKLDFKEVRHALLHEDITTISAVPTLFYGLIHHPDMSDIEYSGMKTLVSGGSALSVEISNAFKERFHADIRKGYGITEASPVCSVNRKHAPIVNRHCKLDQKSSSGIRPRSFIFMGKCIRGRSLRREAGAWGAAPQAAPTRAGFLLLCRNYSPGGMHEERGGYHGDCASA